MKEWQYISLGDVCDVVAGGTPSRKKLKYFGGDVPWVKISDMLQGIITYTDETITKAGIENSAAKVLPSGTVLLSIFATIGRTAILGIDAATNQAIVGIIPKPEVKLNTSFLRYCLDDSIKELRKEARGVAQININSKILKSLTIPLPPLPEQERIVCLLDEADSLRELRGQASARMEKFVPALFHMMFGDTVEVDGKWKVSKIGEITHVKTGGTPSRKEPKYFEGNIPWVKTTEVDESIINDTAEKITKEALKNSNCEIFPPETILVAMYGQGITRGRTGKLGISATTNQACAAILPSTEFDSDYLWTLLELSYEKLRGLGHGGNQPNLNLSMVKSFEIFLPPLALQREFAERVQEARGVQSVQARSEERIEALYQSMLSRAFAGEL